MFQANDRSATPLLSWAAEFSQRENCHQPTVTGDFYSAFNIWGRGNWMLNVER